MLKRICNQISENFTNTESVDRNGLEIGSRINMQFHIGCRCLPLESTSDIVHQFAEIGRLLFKVQGAALAECERSQVFNQTAEYVGLCQQLGQLRVVALVDTV